MNKFNLLIADQDVQHLKFLFHFLDATHRYNIMNANNGEMLLSIVQKQDIHLVLLDWNIVHTYGLSILNTLSQQQDAPPVELLLMLNQKQFKENKKSIEDLSIRYLVKPFSKQEVLWQIQQLLEPSFLQGKIENAEAKSFGVSEEYGNPYLQNLANLEIAFRKQIEMLETEKEKIIREKEELEAQKIEVQEELEIQKAGVKKEFQILKAERELFEIEKDKFIRQKELFEQEEKQLFEARIQLKDDKNQVEKDKRWVILEKKNLKNLQKELNYKRNTLSNEKRRTKKPKVKKADGENPDFNQLNDSNKLASNK